jgi:NADH-quinone oxidoreductase subunit N
MGAIRTIDEVLGTQIGFLMPEIFLAVGAMALLMLGVFRGNQSTRLVSWLTVGVLVVVGLMVIGQPAGEHLAFGRSFVVDPFARYGKILCYIGSGAAILMAVGFLRSQKLERFEYPILILLSTLGMSMMVSANDLISLYIGLELQSLALYVLAAFNRDSLRSTEAGLKYFVLSALSSGLLLYGCSLIYGFAGTTNFIDLGAVLVPGRLGIGLIFGLVFLSAGLAFKISAVPFHMWTPDVYEGAPTPVTALFAAAPKVAAMMLFVRVLLSPFTGEAAGGPPEWQQIVVAISILSMAFGAFAAIGQTNIKRLMAYSSIANMGYVLVGLAAGTTEGVRGVLMYLLIYVPMTLGVFAGILAMQRKGAMIEDIEELRGLSRNQPGMAVALLILLFSLAGIPPFAGFFAKWYVFVAAVNAGLAWLAVVAVLTSVVGAYYYVRIVKLMYFDEAADAFDRPLAGELKLVLGLSTFFTLFFVIFAYPLVRMTEFVARSLLA